MYAFCGRKLFSVKMCREGYYGTKIKGAEDEKKSNCVIRDNNAFDDVIFRMRKKGQWGEAVFI